MLPHSRVLEREGPGTLIVVDDNLQVGMMLLDCTCWCLACQSHSLTSLDDPLASGAGRRLAPADPRQGPAGAGGASWEVQGAVQGLADRLGVWRQHRVMLKTRPLCPVVDRYLCPRTA